VTVYFAQTRIDNTKVKIGFTSDLETRRINMSVSVPGGVVILATLEGGKESEEYLHDKFAEYRFSGEWFEFSDPIREFVRDIQNGKVGLIPFIDTAKYMGRDTAEYARDAIEIARQMAVAILNDEFRGVGDTVDACMFRVQQKHGISSSVLHRLRYRSPKDIWAGEFLHLKAIYEQRGIGRGSNVVPIQSATA
jgi:hypothetical protein